MYKGHIIIVNDDPLDSSNCVFNILSGFKHDFRLIVFSKDTVKRKHRYTRSKREVKTFERFNEEVLALEYKDQQKDSKMGLVVVIEGSDDLMGPINHSKCIHEICYNGRHRKTTLIIYTTTFDMIGRRFISCANYIFTKNYSHTRKRKTMWQHTFSFSMTYEEFQAKLIECERKSEWLVCDTKSGSDIYQVNFVEDKMVAFLMGKHKRLGKESLVQFLCDDVLVLICNHLRNEMK